MRAFEEGVARVFAGKIDSKKASLGGVPCILAHSPCVTQSLRTLRRATRLLLIACRCNSGLTKLCEGCKLIGDLPQRPRDAVHRSRPTWVVEAFEVAFVATAAAKLLRDGFRATWSRFLREHGGASN